MTCNRTREPAPQGFRQRFVEDGWRGIERYYGARTDVMLRWIEECGGLEILKAERREWRGRRMATAIQSVAPPRDG